MNKQIFINLPVSDVVKSTAFYTQLGFTLNPQFSDATASCMVWAENIFVMLLGKEKFMGFTNRPIANTQETVSAINSVSLESKAAVLAISVTAIAAGGTAPNAPLDYGFMYSASIMDLDGNYWEFFYMDMSQMPPAENA